MLEVLRGTFMSEVPTAYEKMGGKPFFDTAMEDLFRHRIPADTTTEPTIAEFFGSRLFDPAFLNPHMKGVGWAFGAATGGPGHDTFTPEWVAEKHLTPIPGPIFDRVVTLAVMAMQHAGEIHQKPPEQVEEGIGMIAEAIPALRGLMVARPEPVPEVR